jgi:hypothetical protein
MVPYQGEENVNARSAPGLRQKILAKRIAEDR